MYDLTLDYSRDANIPDHAKTILKANYMLETENSPQEAFARAASAFADDQAHAQRLYDYASRFWFMFSTPILSNGGTDRGMPISCFLNYVDDSREGLGEHYLENIWLSTGGGGIGGYWGAVRSQGETTSIGNKTTGIIPFMHVVDSQMLAFNQGATRRGSYAAYLDVNHPEILEFLSMRKPSGGDSNRKNLNLHHGVNITDAFMDAVFNNRSYDLVDPHSGGITASIPARDVWFRILELRMETGEPYLHFIDASNRALPYWLKNRGFKINQSNLCTEITLPTGPDYTAVCCLSSVNAEFYDEWKNDPLFIEDVVRMLDNALTFFIHNGPEGAWRAKKSASTERSIGLGVMGWHAWLQKRGIPFESAIAIGQNRTIFKRIRQAADDASKKLAYERGPAPALIGHEKKRFSHVMAVAPNASSSLICGGTSPSIEPWRANAYVQKTLSGSFLIKNPYLEKALEEYVEYHIDPEGVWSSIIANKGSVQHIGFLSDQHKDVFKTAVEIDQNWVIDQAAARQDYIDQAQSVNLFFPADADKAYFNRVHFRAWQNKLKSLYYCRSEAVRRAENVSTRVKREVRPDFKEEATCVACEG